MTVGNARSPRRGCECDFKRLSTRNQGLEADIFRRFRSVWVPAGPAVLLASERARRSTAMRRADDHRIPLHVTHISLPLLLERQRRMLETESLSRQTVFLSYSLSLSLSLSHPLSLSSNATLVIDAQVPLPETRNSSRILSYARCCSLKTCFLIKELKLKFA